MPCPNLISCKLVNADHLLCPDQRRIQYLTIYCQAEENWMDCKRLFTNTRLGFCPDFVEPDTELTLAEIIEQIDREINKE